MIIASFIQYESSVSKPDSVLLIRKSKSEQKLLRKILWCFFVGKNIILFYKPNSIYKTKGACYDKKIQRRCPVKKSCIKGCYEFPLNNMNETMIWCCYLHKNVFFCFLNQKLYCIKAKMVCKL